ncbi:hypothetical protein F511_03985 [Dorcoceras hygrometricum]|uniref:Uncharacterized protein n=1 Tax=Dorcoceras hygrometricum TaxID=472368 RepID=A0A2Z7A6I3_9LAMI|nr:hypothetical protein F511_03985 [Dorcoceras hygrometricum]
MSYCSAVLAAQNFQSPILNQRLLSSFEKQGPTVGLRDYRVGRTWCQQELGANESWAYDAELVGLSANESWAYGAELVGLSANESCAYGAELVELPPAEVPMRIGLIVAERIELSSNESWAYGAELVGLLCSGGAATRGVGGEERRSRVGEIFSAVSGDFVAQTRKVVSSSDSLKKETSIVSGSSKEGKTYLERIFQHVGSGSSGDTPSSNCFLGPLAPLHDVDARAPP